MGFDFQENAAAGAQIFSSFSSVFQEGTEFTITGAKIGNQIVSDDAGNQYILCVGHKQTDVSLAAYEANKSAFTPKGYVHLQTSLGEDLGLAGLFRSTVGKDANGKIVAPKPSGSAVDTIAAAIAAIKGPKTLTTVQAAVLPVVTGKVLVCHTSQIFCTTKDGFTYPKLIKSYDFKQQFFVPSTTLNCLLFFLDCD